MIEAFKAFQYRVTPIYPAVSHGEHLSSSVCLSHSPFPHLLLPSRPWSGLQALPLSSPPTPSLHHINSLSHLKKKKNQNNNRKRNHLLTAQCKPLSATQLLLSLLFELSSESNQHLPSPLFKHSSHGLPYCSESSSSSNTPRT